MKQDLAKWAVEQQVYSHNVRWLIQVPRIYDIFKKNGAVQNFGEQPLRDIKIGQQLLTPSLLVDIEQLSSTRIGRIRDVTLALAKFPQQKTVHRTETNFVL